MSTQQVVAFWQRVQSDRNLLEMTRAVSRDTSLPELDALCTIAASAGFECTPEEFDAVENVVRFWDWVNQEDRLHKRLESARAKGSHDETLREIVQIAGEAGFTFTTDQLDTVTRVLFEARSAARAQLNNEAESPIDRLTQP